MKFHLFAVISTALLAVNTLAQLEKYEHCAACKIIAKELNWSLGEELNSGGKIGKMIALFST